MGTKMNLIAIVIFLALNLFVGCREKSMEIRHIIDMHTSDSIFVYKDGKQIGIGPYQQGEINRLHCMVKQCPNGKPYHIYRPDSILHKNGSRFDFIYYEKDSLWNYGSSQPFRSDLMILSFSITDDFFN